MTTTMESAELLAQSLTFELMTPLLPDDPEARVQFAIDALSMGLDEVDASRWRNLSDGERALLRIAAAVQEIGSMQTRIDSGLQQSVGEVLAQLGGRMVAG